jgi:retinol dehydrogenase-13
MDETKTFLVTGATGAIGYGIARLIAENKSHIVVILARNKAKAHQTVERLKGATSNMNISYRIADLSRKEELKRLAASWESPLDVLINNAGATPRSREETPEGIEMQWATNVLGYFWMIKFFAPILSSSKTPRIVNVASYWAGDMDMSDPEFKKRHYNNDTAYRQSKQADRMLTVAFADRLKSSGITVNACHPGDVRSTLASNLGYGGHETPEQGAATPAWLATAADVKNSTGKYFEHRRESTCRFGQDRDHVEKLYQICDAY